MSRNIFRHILSGSLVAAFLSGTPMVIPAYADDMTSQEGAMLQDEVRSLRDAVEHMRRLQRETGPSAPPDDSGPDSDSGGRPAYMGDNGGASSQGDLVVQLMERVKTLEQHDRELHGALDQATHDLDARLNVLSKQVQDARFAARTKGMALSGSAATTAAAGSAVAASGTSLLHEARADLQKRNFTAARDAANAYLETVKGTRKIEGKLVLAQALAGNKEYKQAAVAYYDAYNLSPKTITGPQALLGVTSSLMALGNDKAACQALDKLRTEFPKPSSWVSRAVMIDSQKAKCTPTNS